MNFYVLVEGLVSEKEIYKFWIPLVNPNLNYVPNLFDIQRNNFSIFSGGGYPFYFDVIESAIYDVNSHKAVDRLVIAVDSEDIDLNEKYNEIRSFVSDFSCSAEVIIIIQHFCIETWALGNKRVGPRSPKNPRLRTYKKIFNVLNQDPELLPPLPEQGLNRAQFAEKYLRTMLNDKNKNLTYSKRNPKALLHKSYFGEVKKRLETHRHINSFQMFIDAFS